MTKREKLCKMLKFSRYDRVRVVSQDRYWSFELLGKTGTVDAIYGDDLAVSIDGVSNPYSASGRFYFKYYQLALVNDCNENKEVTTMQNITNYLNIAKIQFVDGNNTRTYEYANFDPFLNPGDLCVVMSANHGLGVAKVVEIVDRNDLETRREVVAKVWTDEYDKRVETRAKASELKAKMQERAKQLQDIALYQMLAKDDPAMMELLSEYQALSSK
jgi:hypothetical protein